MISSRYDILLLLCYHYFLINGYKFLLILTSLGNMNNAILLFLMLKYFDKIIFSFTKNVVANMFYYIIL